MTTSSSPTWLWNGSRPQGSAVLGDGRRRHGDRRGTGVRARGLNGFCRRAARPGPRWRSEVRLWQDPSRAVRVGPGARNVHAGNGGGPVFVRDGDRACLCERRGARLGSPSLPESGSSAGNSGEGVVPHVRPFSQDRADWVSLNVDTCKKVAGVAGSSGAKDVVDWLSPLSISAPSEPEGPCREARYGLPSVAPADSWHRGCTALLTVET